MVISVNCLLFLPFLFFLHFLINFVDWYTGVIVNANSDRYCYDIKFNDGDLQRNLVRNKIRPFINYQLNEIIEIDIIGNTENYYLGHIVGIYEEEDELLDVIIKGKKSIIQVEWSNVRRLGNEIIFADDLDDKEIIDQDDTEYDDEDDEDVKE